MDLFNFDDLEVELEDTISDEPWLLPYNLPVIDSSDLLDPTNDDDVFCYLDLFTKFRKTPEDIELMKKIISNPSQDESEHGMLERVVIHEVGDQLPNFTIRQIRYSCHTVDDPLLSLHAMFFMYVTLFQGLAEIITSQLEKYNDEKRIIFLHDTFIPMCKLSLDALFDQNFDHDNIENLITMFVCTLSSMWRTQNRAPYAIFEQLEQDILANTEAVNAENLRKAAEQSRARALQLKRGRGRGARGGRGRGRGGRRSRY